MKWGEWLAYDNIIQRCSRSRNLLCMHNGLLLNLYLNYETLSITGHISPL